MQPTIALAAIATVASPHRVGHRCQDGTCMCLVIPDRVAKRAATRFTPDRNGCHLSRAADLGNGYKQVGWRDTDGVHRNTTVHRAAWVYANGPIPCGLTVDHLCRVRSCVNLAHLRLLTLQDNGRDGAAFKAARIAERNNA